MKKIRIGVVVGSLRKESFNRKVADNFMAMMPEDFDMIPVNIDLPMFNQDYDDEGSTPKEWVAFRDEIASMDGFLFLTPEYNRSVPPVLKNALDIASRPYGQNQWDGKPGAIISASPGGQGAFGANHHLRQTLSFLNIYTMQQPEIYLAKVDAMLDEKGGIANDGTRAFLQSCADAFAAWVRRFI